MNFAKRNVKVMTNDGVKEMAGYEYAYSLADGREVPMHVCNMNGNWRVVDPKTGRTLCVGCKTRGEAVKLADSMEVKPAFTNLVDMAKYGKMIMEFEEKCNGPVIEAIASPETGGRLVKVKDETKPKAPKAPAKPKAAAKQKEPKKPTVPTVADMLQIARKWCEKKVNVVAYRKNELPETPVRVAGETKPYKAELTGMGFRWSPKEFWYYGPKEQERLSKASA